MRILLTLILIFSVLRPLAAADDVPLINASFDEGLGPDGAPAGWKRYGDPQQEFELVPGVVGKALLINDTSATAETGVLQIVPAKPGLTYHASVRVKADGTASTAGAQLQLRFQPSDKFVQVPLNAGAEFTEISAQLTAPPDTVRALVYLYTHRDPTPRVIVDEVKLQSGVEAAPVTQPQPAVPEPVVAQYDKLKALHLTTWLVQGAQPQAEIVTSAAYRKEADRLAAAIKQTTGATLPIRDEATVERREPLTRNLILFGNRSTNRFISRLYDEGYSFLDLKYPGPGGYVVRTLHNPYGDGHNVLFIGGSDEPGVTAGTDALLAYLKEHLPAARGQLSLDWLALIKLSDQYKAPQTLKEMELWEASKMYGSSGYFGWNMISKHLANYYLTGNKHSLQEALRLSFPDAQALKEIDQEDGERIENKNDPPAGPYHYAAHMMIMLWDLVEESPDLTDAQRLKMTNAFARQLKHRVPEGVYGLTSPRATIGDRHGDWAAFSLYVLGRYFQRDYPSPVWQRCMAAADHYFDALKRTYWVAGNNDHLFWFTSYYDPMLNYLLVTGRREPEVLANLRRALESQEIFSTGLESDWGVAASSLSMLNKAAYVLNDGRWLWYRERIPLDQNVLRFGQSFWPGPDFKATPPTDVTGKWTIHWMPKEMWQARATGFPLEQSFRWGSYRSALGPASDYILLDGYNGAGRNPYHTFDILELRLNGTTMLKGYGNQVLSSADGMVEPQVAMDARLLHQDVIGGVAVAVAEVPKLPFANWRRSLIQRAGRYAVVVDDLAFRTDSDNVKLETSWEMPGALWKPEAQAIRTREYPRELPKGWLDFAAIKAPLTCGPDGPEKLISKLESLNMVLLKAPAPGSWVEMSFELKEPAEGEVFADLLNYTDRGYVTLSLDGGPPTPQIDHYSAAVATQRVPLGTRKLAAGPHTLRLQVVGQRPEAGRCYAGLLGVRIQPVGATQTVPPMTCELRPGDALDVQPGNITRFEWRGPVRNGQHRYFFTLLGENRSGTDDGLACLRIADNAAALALPEAGVIASGSYSGLQGDLALLTEKHLYGRNLLMAGLREPLLQADVPVDVDWDFEKASLHVAAEKPATLALALREPAVQLDGKPVTGQAQVGSLVALQVPAGRHLITSATPSTAVWKPLTAQLPELLTQGRKLRAAQLAAQSAPAKVNVPAMVPAWQADVSGKAGESITLPLPDGDGLAVPVGKAVAVLDAAGKLIRKLEVAGDVRCLNWWAEPKLLLVGCADEKVIAFDDQGNRRWEFTSEMDPYVYEQGKQYWFKSAHPGVHGLYSGVFDGGKSRAFVGSACTLEILDDQGKLVKRTPVMWGPGRRFLLVDAADGSRNLLVARWHNDGVAFATVNSKQMKDIGHSYDAVPAGHTYVAGWDCMNREDNFAVDLDGDGKREVVSAINGTWNRVSIYAEDGKPLYNAQFGSGVPQARANLRMMDVGDLNGDGKQEILVATASGLIVCLDAQARKLWSRQLPAAPTVVRAVTRPSRWVCAGCQDGQVFALDATGQITRAAKVEGRPVDLRVLSAQPAPVAAVICDTGRVTGFSQ